VIKDEVIRMLYHDLQKAAQILALNPFIEQMHPVSMTFINASLNTAKRFIK
jgi:hypothetical protein